MPRRVEGGRHVLAWDDVSFEVDARTGGRVTALRLGGPQPPDRSGGRRRQLRVDVLDQPAERLGLAAGRPRSTTPPTARRSRGRDRHAQRAQPAPGRRDREAVLRRPRARRGDRSSTGSTTSGRGADRRRAPWQITRVGPGGLTFYPSGDGSFPPSNLGVRDALGVTWYDYDAAAITDHQKHFADGREGWLAHVDGDALLVKTFAAVPRAAHAPGEAQIEIYASPRTPTSRSRRRARTRRSRRARRSPGGWSGWRAGCRRSCPSAVGSEALLAHVRALVAADAAAAG